MGGAKASTPSRRSTSRNVILADSSVWIDHFRRADQHLLDLLGHNSVAIHPAVHAEIALGGIPQRAQTLATLGDLPKVDAASEFEVLRLIDVQSLQSTGLSYVDVHLLASTMISAETMLWTRDRRLATEAQRLGVAWQP